MIKFSECRNSKKCRMGFIALLMSIVILLLLFWGKAKTMLFVILVLLAIAIGLEGFDYDADLKKLWETGNYNESRVETIKDSDGNTIKLITGNCNSKEFDLNCKDFATQGEAQDKYDECAYKIKQSNPEIKDLNKLDIYGLDGNNNGIVCEFLPKVAK
ncbi:hypothetical protein CSB07_00460 [Candidatus Gracilibacteria bacterium]|nr:MAG: hypothetical protein CSB07_00460 [Candidatus Gracilibacteria bacterium]